MSAARRLALASVGILCMLVGGSVFASAPAFASEPPEAPAPVTVEALTARSATFEGELNPGKAGVAGTYELGTYEFLYNQGGGCEGGSVAPEPAGLSLGGGQEALPPVVVGGLAPGSEYAVCLLARNGVGEVAVGPPVAFVTPAVAPVVVGESVSGVEAAAATFEAEVIPEGAVATAHFEYLPQARYEADGDVFGEGTETTVESAAIGSDDVEHPVQPARVVGLLPGKTYDYRVLASSECEAGKRCVTEGEDKTFTTPPAPGSTPPESCPNEQSRAEQPTAHELPDCRAYEMVSPIETNGQDATDEEIQMGPRAAESGDALVYASRGSFASWGSFAGGAGAIIENEMLSRRGPQGWNTQNITPAFEPHKAETGDLPYQSMAFTPELDEAAFSTSASLTPEAPRTGPDETDLYLGSLSGSHLQYLAQTHYPMSASPDLSHLLLGESGEIVEWSDGETFPVSVSNSGTPMTASVGGAAPDEQFAFRRGDTWHALSSDGSRAYFSSPTFTEEESFDPGHAPPQLFVRVNPEQPQSPMSGPGGEECAVSTDACTIEVSASQRATPDPRGPQPARFWGASVAGDRVFFTSTAELTEDAYTGLKDNAANLYEYDVESGRLSDLTVDTGDIAEGAAVQGVAQISDDGSYVYYVADGVLTHEPNSEGREPVAGEPNLYIAYEGATVFIATLSPNDTSDWIFSTGFNAPTEAGPATNSAVTSPDGALLAFTSELSLTGYDNEQASEGECKGQVVPETGEPAVTGSCREVYLYDAATGGLVCASCDPTGARPVGGAGLRERSSTISFGEYRPRNLLADGTLFFDSSDALVAHSSDGRENVYEYEDGHVHVISDVAGGYGSFFMDASPEGRDVFFATVDKLLPEDPGGNVVVYDARVDGGFPVVSSAPSCDNGDSCKPPPSAQPGVFAPTGSATFSGLGNAPAPAEVGKPVVVKRALTRAQELTKALRVCRAKRKKGARVICEKRARARRGARVKKSAGRANRDRGAR